MDKLKVEVWKPVNFSKVPLGTAFSVSVFDQKEEFWLETILEPSDKNLILRFPHRHSVIFYSVSFADKMNYVICKEKANGGIYFVENSILYRKVGLDYHNQYIESIHFVIPSVDITIEILSKDNPVVFIDDDEFMINVDA